MIAERNEGVSVSVGYVYDIIRKKDYILVEIGGDANIVADVLSLAATVLNVVKDSGLRRVLFDERSVTLNLDQHDVYKCTEALGDHLPAEGVRVAVVHNRKDIEVYRCFETMLQNRSINYKLFDGLSEAETWLLSR